MRSAHFFFTYASSLPQRFKKLSTQSGERSPPEVWRALTRIQNPNTQRPISSSDERGRRGACAIAAKRWLAEKSSSHSPEQNAAIWRLAQWSRRAPSDMDLARRVRERERANHLWRQHSGSPKGGWIRRADHRIRARFSSQWAEGDITYSSWLSGGAADERFAWNDRLHLARTSSPVVGKSVPAFATCDARVQSPLREAVE